ncbi:NAD(P)-dependent alcohol dehydrogenase [Sphingomonas sinipercae]|uniref:NAD(P)-dependent alcohol dehydrogenase n=1 Tax=Sphingomonas sinipercae TaxID=2714944 RepID=A0A6G7ZKJ0_9SPHN|nr:NAD(P)-dependent alcohol dehydrogenase [Sphingomonas sinipercae]QIL01435.1 NAD(P)-dependent alcohol dehydrogenase [Sphingomonas sinipercae]
MPTQAKGWGTEAADQPLRPMTFERRDLRPDDVAIQITYAGICHSDLHTARNDWGGTIYPNIPGHEIVGRVTAIGDEVTRHRVGDLVAVGCMVDSCMSCDQCLSGWEVFCREGMVGTYNGVDRHDGSITKGGYTDHVVVRDHFVLKVPDGMDEARVAPLLCAGITTYSPLRQYNVGPGTKMAVIGLGGLGHMGVKLGAALGAHVTMITTTPSKGEDARALGAHDVIVSTDAVQMEAAATRFDFILNTIPVSHEIDGYLQLLGRSGRMVIVGALLQMPGFVGANLIFWNRAVGGSAIGGIPETQEMLDLCAKEGIYPEVELIAMDEVNDAYERLLRNDVRYRFVIDMARGL